MYVRRIGFNQLLNVRTSRHPRRCERAAYQHLPRMDRQPAVFILVHESVLLQHRPCFFERDRLHAVENVVWNFRTAVGEAVSMPIWRVLDDIIASEKSLLRVSLGGSQYR